MTRGPRPAEDIPAVILCDPATMHLRVAGLTLLDRLIVTVHRAGCGEAILVGAGDNVSLKRSKALGVPIRFTTELPEGKGPFLLASTSLLASVDDVRSMLQHGGRLNGSDGKPLPMGMVSSPARDIENVLNSLARIVPSKPAYHVFDEASARTAEQALWASIQSSADGAVDRVFNRPCGRLLSKRLVSTPVSPNAVSLVSIFIGLVAAGLFAIGEHATSIVAAVVFQISAIVDCVDGDIARAAFKESPLGKWLDLAGDQVVHIGVFAGIAMGSMQAGMGNLALWLGAGAVAGALLSFAVVLRGMSRTSDRENVRLQRLIDGATNRDFSVLVLLLALIGKLDWFLWLAAIGSHVFWITALALQAGARNSGDSNA